MTISQYKKASALIAETIESLGSSPRKAYGIQLPPTPLQVREPDSDTAFQNRAGSEVIIQEIANPNNPNPKFRSLRPGTMTATLSTGERLDLADCRFDPGQFSDLLALIRLAEAAKMA